MIKRFPLLSPPEPRISCRSGKNGTNGSVEHVPGIGQRVLLGRGVRCERMYMRADVEIFLKGTAGQDANGNEVIGSGMRGTEKEREKVRVKDEGWRFGRFLAKGVRETDGGERWRSSIVSSALPRDREREKKRKRKVR